MTETALLIFPHQLFKDHPGLVHKPSHIFLSEDSLFFGDRQYPARFHWQKLILHRASMKAYAAHLQDCGYQPDYYDYAHGASQLKKLFQDLKDSGIERLLICDVVDFALEKRLMDHCRRAQIRLQIVPSPGFINSRADNQAYLATRAALRKRWFMADFYRAQRQRLNILVEPDGTPIGGRWSFDADNRRKIPKSQLPWIPKLNFPKGNAYIDEAQSYVRRHYPHVPGQGETFLYPVTHQAAQQWLGEFLTKRFHDFGPYEDAIVADQNWLYHGVLTPMLNIGLLTPGQIVRQALDHARANDVPMNSLEGFIRQIIGWREFIRASYDDLGVVMRRGNVWQHKNPMPDAFYTASTGVDPVDNVIRRVLKTGYCHHIERLMVLGGFMFLCEIDPAAVYQWFMDMFVDSYDWVMVPNVYAMSQNAAGDLMTTKPYFSGSNYVRKMSHYTKGPWSDIWDGLYWRWIIDHADALDGHPRWAMMVRQARAMAPETKARHQATAHNYLQKLFGKGG